MFRRGQKQGSLRGWSQHLAGVVVTNWVLVSRYRCSVWHHKGLVSGTALYDTHSLKKWASKRKKKKKRMNFSNFWETHWLAKDTYCVCNGTFKDRPVSDVEHSVGIGHVTLQYIYLLVHQLLYVVHHLLHRILDKTAKNERQHCFTCL